MKYPSKVYEALGVNENIDKDCMDQKADFALCQLNRQSHCEHKEDEYKVCMRRYFQAKTNIYSNTAYFINRTKAREQSLSPTIDQNMTAYKLFA